MRQGLGSLPGRQKPRGCRSLQPSDLHTRDGVLSRDRPSPTGPWEPGVKDSTPCSVPCCLPRSAVMGAPGFRGVDGISVPGRGGEEGAGDGTPRGAPPPRRAQSPSPGWAGVWCPAAPPGQPVREDTQAVRGQSLRDAAGPTPAGAIRQLLGPRRDLLPGRRGVSDFLPPVKHCAFASLLMYQLQRSQPYKQLQENQ